MANVRLDDLLPWLSIALPADDPPPGFRLGPEETPPYAWSVEPGRILPGLYAGPARSSFATTHFNEAARAPTDTDLFEFLYSQSPAPAPLPDSTTPRPYYPYRSLPLPQEPRSVLLDLLNGEMAPKSNEAAPSSNIVRPSEPTPGFRMPTDGQDTRPSPPWIGIGSNAPMPGFNVAPVIESTPGFRMPADSSAHANLSDDAGFTFTKYDPRAAAPPLRFERPGLPAQQRTSGIESAVDRAVLTSFPQVPPQKALDRINADSRAPSAVNNGIDPRFLIQAQAQPPARQSASDTMVVLLCDRPPRRLSHPNRSWRTCSRGSAARIATGYIRCDCWICGGGDCDSGQHSETTPNDPDREERLEAWRKIVRVVASSRPTTSI